MKAILTIGVSASGKTTWAHEFLKNNPNGWGIVCRDDIRFNILEEKDLIQDFNAGIPWAKWKWAWENEVNVRWTEQVKFHHKWGNNIIVADTNLNTDRRRDMIVVLLKLGYEIEIKEFNITFEEAVLRDTARPNGVGVSVIARQYDQWLDYLHIHDRFEKIVHDPKLPSAIICDIDGTLATMSNRSPYDWNRVGEDSVNVVLRNILESLRYQYIIILLSGRDSICRHQTIEWLKTHNVTYAELYMREQNDRRPDTEVKWEMYKKYIQPYYNIAGVFDDRPKIVRMWAQHGLKVFALGNQHIEF